MDLILNLLCGPCIFPSQMWGLYHLMALNQPLLQPCNQVMNLEPNEEE